jgi:hypothetical protein
MELNKLSFFFTHALFKQLPVFVGTASALHPEDFTQRA